MAILGFPSSAIIGDLVWTGDAVSLAASDSVSISGFNNLSLASSGPLANSFISINQYGIGFNTDDESTLVTIGVNGAGIGMTTDGPMSIGSTANVNVTATETLTLTGGNNISGGVNINTQQAMSLSANGVLNASSGDTSLSLDGVHAKLSWGAGNYIQVGEEFATIQCGETTVNGDNQLNLQSGASVLVTGNTFKFNNAKVATQPFAIAAAVALG